MKDCKLISTIKYAIKPNVFNHALNHWLYQRISAVIMIFLTIWLMNFIIVNYAINIKDFKYFLSNPKHFLALALFIVIGLYHSMLGMQVIIEDYVSNKHYQSITINIFRYLTIATIVATIIALIFFTIK